jgi:hypothetical protein
MMPRVLVLLIAAMVCRAPGQVGEVEPESGLERLVEHLQMRDRSAELQAEAVEAFEAGDLAEAERLFTEQAALDPTNFTAHYNLACVRALAGDTDAAWAHLEDALKNGFIDAYQLRRDESLAAVRDDPRVRALLEHFDRLIEAHRAASVAAAERWLGRCERRTLGPLRVECLSSHDAVATDRAVRELEMVAGFADSIIPGLGDAGAGALDPWVVVTLPDQRRFESWTLQTFGPAARASFSAIGGAYDHDQRRLVARDLGATLRHEFFHVLLWRDMTHRGLVAPIWIQEGLASLVEDGEDRGRFVPVASWRTNIAKRLEKNGRLPRLEELTELTQERFSANRPLRQYALARTFFLFLYDRGVLGAWYEEYAKNAATDPDGLAALSTVLGMDADAMHEAYREWVRGLPMVPETGEDLEVQLGVDLSNGDGDGPRVVGFTGRAARGETGLRLGDVITSVNGQSTGDLQELIRVLGGLRPGETVILEYRRGKLHGEAKVTLGER